MTDYADLSAFVALPRVTGLALSQDGVAAGRRACSGSTGRAARYVSALWEVPLDGGEPVRLTRSEKGESAPAFLPDGSLLFTSARPEPDADGDDEDAAVWVLPPAGEPRVLARTAGGLSGPVVARHAGAVLAAGSRLPAPTRSRRRTRSANGTRSGGGRARTARSTRSCTPASRSGTGTTSSAPSRRGCSWSSRAASRGTWRPTPASR